MKKILGVFGGIIILFLLVYLFKVSNNQSDSDYFVDTNLKFNGVIWKVKPLTSYGHDYGVILVEIYHSNMKHYDPRDSLERFLGVLKDGRMELIFNRISEVKENDSIEFNIEEYKIFRNSKLIRDEWISMPPKDLFKPFNEVRKVMEL